MKIALFPSAFYPHIGGVEELTRQLAFELLRRSHSVVVITERWPRDLPKVEVHQGIDVRRFPMRVPAGGVKSKATYLLTHRQVLSEICRCLVEFEVDVIHAQCVSSTTWYGLAAGRKLGVPVVATLQGELSMDTAGIFRRPGIAQTIMKKALGTSDAITACSQHTLDEAERFSGGGLAASTRRVVPNGVQLSELAASAPHLHRRPYVLAIGRHVPEKGFDILLKAWDRACDVGLDLLIAGDGPERGRLMSLVHKLGLGETVQFVGRTERGQTASLFRGCSFFVLPSRHEPFGIVLLEAMAAGKAVIATCVGGVPEVVVDGVTALLVRGESPEDLAAAIQRLAADSTKREQLATAGQSHVRQFSWSRIADQYLEIYRSAGAR